MNADETVAAQFLQGLGLGEVVFEPDGNRPPDFLVDGRIAVEARRLNQNVATGEGHEGLETLNARD